MGFSVGGRGHQVPCFSLDGRTKYSFCARRYPLKRVPSWVHYPSATLEGP